MMTPSRISPDPNPESKPTPSWRNRSLRTVAETGENKRKMEALPAETCFRPKFRSEYGTNVVTAAIVMNNPSSFVDEPVGDWTAPRARNGSDQRAAPVNTQVETSCELYDLLPTNSRLKMVKKEKFNAFNRTSSSAIRFPPALFHGWLMSNTPAVPSSRADAFVLMSFSPSRGTANNTVNIADICERNETAGTGRPSLIAPMYVRDAISIIPPPTAIIISSLLPGIVFFR